MQQTSTHGLIERARAGDQEAFSQLFEKYRRRLAVLMHYRMGGQLHAAYEVDDVLQEILMRAFRDLDQFEYSRPGSFFHWLSSIGHHVVQDLGRYQNRERRRPEELIRFRSESNPVGPDPADTATPSRILARREAVDSLIARLDQLADDYRQVILLAKIEGLTTQEVAARMGRSREEVALLLHRAIKRLRALSPR